MKEIIASDYSIWIGENSLSKLNISSYSKVAILVDENTKKDCLHKLPKIDNSILIEIQSGEEKKNITTCNFIWEQLTKNNFDRNSLLINLGGGVIGDMGGFCASTYKRGIDFIQIPTTLLAMVDASVGGKLGVDFNGLKNQIGIFNYPNSVIINPEFLSTLPENELKSGFAEVVKHTLIADKNLWNKIISTSFNELIWEEIIETSIQIKNKIVESDPFEKGERKKLNFGHTFGHAIESYYLEKGTPILHGEAIALGMMLESDLSDLTVIEKETINIFLYNFFQIPELPPKHEIIDLMKGDKKNKDGKINFSLLNGIGNCSIDNLFLADDL